MIHHVFLVKMNIHLKMLLNYLYIHHKDYNNLDLQVLFLLQMKNKVNYMHGNHNRLILQNMLKSMQMFLIFQYNHY